MALATRPAVAAALQQAKVLLAIRCASTAYASSPRASRARDSSQNAAIPSKKKKKNTIASKPCFPRELSADVRKFFRPDGRLVTTPANARFFRENPTIDHDHGKMARLSSFAPPSGPRSAADVEALCREYGVQLGFSPLHVIHPHHLAFFEPRGHPLAPKLRADYARRAREQPLWAFGTGCGDRAVVRVLTKRRLLGAVFRRLRALGYASGGSGARREEEKGGEGKEIRGTLWVKVLRPQVAAGKSLDRFGEVVAGVLDEHCARRVGEPWNGVSEEERQAAMGRQDGRLNRRELHDKRGGFTVRDAAENSGSGGTRDSWDLMRERRRVS